MRIVLYLILMALMSGCDVTEFKVDYESSPKLKLVNEIRSKVAAKLNKDFGLIPCGTGAQMMHQIEMLALCFDYRNLVDVQKGRQLVVTALNAFLSAINEDERIRPYLSNYPFEPKNIQIYIYLKNPDGKSVALGNFCVISSIEGLLEFDVRDRSTNRLKTIYKETFEEAVEQTKLCGCKPFKGHVNFKNEYK